MQADRRADVWDEVWAEYDARQAGRQALSSARSSGLLFAAAMPSSGRQATGGAAALYAFPAQPWRQPQRDLPAAARQAAPIPVRPVAQTLLAAVAGLVVVAAWLVLPWLLALRLAVPIGQNDAPGLLHQFDVPAAMASVRAGMAAEVPSGAGEGATRFLSEMAERMAASWETPEGVSAWLAVRTSGGRYEGSPAALSGLRSARPTGLASYRIEYGPSEGEGGVAFDMAWQGDGFRVTGVHFLHTPPEPLGGGALVASR